MKWVFVILGGAVFTAFAWRIVGIRYAQRAGGWPTE